MQYAKEKNYEDAFRNVLLMNQGNHISCDNNEFIMDNNNNNNNNQGE